MGFVEWGLVTISAYFVFFFFAVIYKTNILQADVKMLERSISALKAEVRKLEIEVNNVDNKGRNNR